MKKLFAVVMFVGAVFLVLGGIGVVFEGKNVASGFWSSIFGVCLALWGFRLVGQEWALNIPGIVIGTAAAVSITFAMIWAANGPGSTATAKSKLAPIMDDKGLVSLYYTNLMAKTDEADQMFKPFTVALQSGDILGATQIALKIKQPMNSKWGEISRLEAPNLQNKEAKAKLDKAKEAISGAYLYKATMVRDFIDFAESQNLKKVAELKNTAETIQLLALGGTANLVEAADMVGFKLSDMHK